MKKLIAAALALAVALPGAAIAVDAIIDLSAYSNEELIELHDQIDAELIERGVYKYANLPEGAYTVGIDIPEGSYLVTASEGYMDDFVNLYGALGEVDSLFSSEQERAEYNALMQLYSSDIYDYAGSYNIYEGQNEMSKGYKLNSSSVYTGKGVRVTVEEGQIIEFTCGVVIEPSVIVWQ